MFIVQVKIVTFKNGHFLMDLSRVMTSIMNIPAWDLSLQVHLP